MKQASVKPLSLDDFLEMPETEPESEYFDNEIIQKSFAGGKHSVIQGELPFFINQNLRSKRIARAFLELRCTFGGMSIVPDISVFRWERIVRDPDSRIANIFNILPDWMIEILSPDQRQGKLVKKILFALEHGTEIAWLLDPDEELIFIYRANQTLYQTVELCDRPEQVLPMPDFAINLQLTVENIFNWLNE
ncbi:MAG: Uma2 family endonuclease [Pseudanabaena sp. CAN_BIN31]|nr:Uma2 family endonuclease [Pseudanabaena sp. CAN_BIN31]